MIVPFLAGLALLQAAPARDYVPDAGWQDDQWGRTFYERWFGDQLRAMGEPPFSGDADLAGYRERFRLLVLPSFWPGYAWRLDVRQDGSAVLRWARLSGRGGYAPGRLVRQGSRPLRAAELRAWRQALTAAALPTLARQIRDEGVTTDADGSQNVSICVDAPMFVFEHLAPGRRDYVIRDCDIEDPLQRLLHILSRMKPRNRMN
jgi:hypothetical protein